MIHKKSPLPLGARLTAYSENRKTRCNLGREEQYSWDRPRPSPPRLNLTNQIPLGAWTGVQSHEE